MKSIEDQAMAFSKFDAATDVGTDLGSYRQGLFEGFFAGYQAAKDQLQPQPFYKGADVYIIDANNPLPKPMPLSIAEQDQLADTSKVMNSPEKLDSWISVKERLPEDGQDVLACVNGQVLISYVHGMKGFSSEWALAENGGTIWPSHWMPLPEAPKDK